MNVFNIPVHEVCRKFKKCIKTLKNVKLRMFCRFRCQFKIFFIWKTAIIFSEKTIGQRVCALLNVFNILITISIKILTIIAKNVKSQEILDFLLILGLFLSKNRVHLLINYCWTTKSCLVELFPNFLIFGVILGYLGSTKNSRSFQNIYRTKLNLCELNSMGNTLQIEYKFGAWQIL